MIDHLTGTTDMHVKLRNPNNPSNCATFEAAGEVYAENVGELSAAEREAWADRHEEEGCEVRTFITHGGDNGMSQIIVPRWSGAGVKLAILTNWNGWLANQFGATIDRLHRHERLPPAG